MTKRPWKLMNFRTSLVHYRKELNEKILEELQEEEIQAEIPDSDEYIFNLRVKYSTCQKTDSD